MKAMVYRSYGPPDVLHIEEVAKPVPGHDEVLIGAAATSVTAGDWRMRKTDPFLARIYNGLFRPKKVNILGFELSGVIETVGKQVGRYRPGDEVFAYNGIGFGGYAEYRCLPESGDTKRGMLALKPSNLDFDAAAVAPLGSLTALSFLRNSGKIRPGQAVLIYGASGSVGTYAVQLGKYFGAEVTGVCSSSNLSLVESLGADRVIDYTTDEFDRHDRCYDLIFDTVTKFPRARRKRMLKKGGKFLHAFQSAKFEPADLELIGELCEAGAIKPVIDRTFDFEDIPMAHAYVETFRKKGNVAVKVA